MFLRNLPCALILTMLFLYSATVSAAKTEISNEVELSPIVVTANRFPQHLTSIAQPVAVIDRADIEATPAASVADLLEYVSGVDVRQRAGHGVQSDVSIRGGSYEQTLILLNGISMSNPQTGHHNMDLPVSLDNIERIEIIKGPAARIYGANAMAGAINIITHRQETPTVSASLKVGEYDYLAEELQTSFSTGSWHNNLAAAQQYSSGFLGDEPTGFNNKTLNYSGYGQIGAHELELGSAYTDKNFGASRFYFNAPYQKEHTKGLVSYLAANMHSGVVDWRPQLTWLHHEDTYISAYGTNDSDSDKYTLQVNGNCITTWGQSNFSVAGERESIDSSNMGNHKRHNYSLFFNHKLELTKTLTVGAGTSAVYYSGWGWEHLPGAEASYNITEHLQWFASVAKSYRIPTYTELYYTIGNIGDPDLQPEEAWSWESGLRWQQKRLTANLSIFRQDSDDLIDWSRLSSATTWQVRNIGQCTTTGIELGFDVKQPLEKLPIIGRIAVNYTYLDHDSDTNGLEYKYILDSLRHQLHGTVYLDWHSRISHVIKARLEERMSGDSSIVVDSKLIYQATDALDLALEGNNLFDEEYIESGDTPMPGRWLMLGVTWHHDFI